MDPALNPAAVLDVRRFIDDRPISRYQLGVASLCAAVVCVEALELTTAQKDQIYRGNAERLLNLKEVGA